MSYWMHCTEKQNLRHDDVLQFTFNQIMGINTTSTGGAAGSANPGSTSGSGVSGGIKNNGWGRKDGSQGGRSTKPRTKYL